MSSSQSFPVQPVASSSKKRVSRPHVMTTLSQPPAFIPNVPLFDALTTVPLGAKKMRQEAFAASRRLPFPSIPVSGTLPSSIPEDVRIVYNDAYLANSSPEMLARVDAGDWSRIFGGYPPCDYCASHSLHSSCSLRQNSLSCATCKANYLLSKKFCSFKSIFRLLQFHILARLPLVVAYRFVLRQGSFTIRDEEWSALVSGLRGLPYYQGHLEELGIVPDIPQAPVAPRRAGELTILFA